MRKVLLSTITLAAFAFVLPITANAAPPSNARAAAPAPAQSQKTLSSAQLKKMASAYQAVTAIRVKYSTKVQNADNKKKAQKIAAEAQTKMKQAIKNHGYTVSEYSTNIKIINQNPKLRKKFIGMIND